MDILIYGLIGVAVMIVITWLRYTIKSLKDPDVIKATNLGMSLTRYYKYKEIWAEIRKIFDQYGSDNPIAKQKVADIISKKVPNMNEWRVFGESLTEEELIGE